MDEADIASEMEERQRLSDYLQTVRTQPVRPKAKGECLVDDCGEPLDLPDQLFCNNQCAKRWEHLKKVRR
jgi:hypothetical protein